MCKFLIILWKHHYLHQLHTFTIPVFSPLVVFSFFENKRQIFSCEFWKILRSFPLCLIRVHIHLNAICHWLIEKPHILPYSLISPISYKLYFYQLDFTSQKYPFCFKFVQVNCHTHLLSWNGGSCFEFPSWSNIRKLSCNVKIEISKLDLRFA